MVKHKVFFKKSLLIKSITDFKESAALHNPKITNVKVMNCSSLDEITNKVFKELLHEKGDPKYKSASDRGSVKVLFQLKTQNFIHHKNYFRVKIGDRRAQAF